MIVSELSKETIEDALKLIESSLTEDTGSSDLETGIDCTTDSIVPHDSKASAAFVSRESGVVCGVEVAKLVAEKFAPRVELVVSVADGDVVEPKQTIATMKGPAHDILTIERTCLNFMCRLSGISTLTHSFVDRVAGTKAQVLDTRKTTPGWRRLEKYAVACGGGTNHRMGLYDAVMLKDNHLAFFRSQVENDIDVIPQALSQSRKWILDNASRLPNGDNTILQLEVDTIEQFKIAIAASNSTQPDIVLLDNMSTEQLATAVKIRDERCPNVLLEASGGVNLDTISGIAATGVDRISVGALTHSALNFDIGLDWISRG
ncbi:carboxylating nicotinate-nucleotide diphosphorylase [Mariniblastus fucicola]|uniref:Probable nicotinate-nucleotide pyrophosphorylase [carboxylating] n=1 Tax=Mariniblastus fucicola TaxID=980251 RepID=A0A5B9P3K3_9BACT|nr:carboxylating nicotinate-nucleotide diphosphorylase [Mariniblastus fucicola]QEG20978.1 Nicotinate-nucleotide pyrophosphorylase [carboxylating] [Mariniblastus fucicola]